MKLSVPPHKIIKIKLSMQKIDVDTFEEMAINFKIKF